MLRLLPFGCASRVFGRSACPGFRLQRGLGLANLFQARRATMQLVRQLVATPVRSALSILGPLISQTPGQPTTAPAVDYRGRLLKRFLKRYRLDKQKQVLAVA